MLETDAVMPVRCAACCEEFLGAVNRCWKCGSTITLNLEAFQTPPIRRSPVALRPKATKPSVEGGVATAELVNETGSSPTQQSGTSTGMMRRRGNPFANETNNAVFVPAASEAMANENAAEKGVWIGLGVGLVAWMLAFVFPPAAIVVAIVAIGLAIWGLSSRKKGIAGAVLVLCVLGFIVGGYQTAKWAYDKISPEFQIPEIEEDAL
jgi:hypothetical protein